jgi:hypothetical protein
MVMDCTNDVPVVVVNKAGYMIGRQLGCEPALQAPVAEQKEKDKREHTSMSPFPDNINGKRQDKTNSQEYAGKAGEIAPCGDSTHQGKQGGDQGPRISRKF